MKTRLDETNHMRKLMGLPLINEGYSGDDKPHWNRLVTKYGDEQCSFWENRNLRHEDLVDNIKRQPKIFIQKLEDAQKSNDKNNRYWGSPFSKIELSKNSIDQFIVDLEDYIIGHCVKGNTGRRIVINSLNELNDRLLDLMKKLEPIGTDIVANFDKEKVTDDLANKTTIKDGVVHVPFSVDDFPKVDWDLYFEDFDVSNNKFGFTDYVVKEYGAGEIDSEEIWKEYQEAILHRLMNEE
jgi:hypothetical protein